jgi:hypothetical protein
MWCMDAQPGDQQQPGRWQGAMPPRCCRPTWAIQQPRKVSPQKPATGSRLSTLLDHPQLTGCPAAPQSQWRPSAAAAASPAPIGLGPAHRVSSQHSLPAGCTTARGLFQVCVYVAVCAGRVSTTHRLHTVTRHLAALLYFPTRPSLQEGTNNPRPPPAHLCKNDAQRCRVSPPPHQHIHMPPGCLDTLPCSPSLANKEAWTSTPTSSPLQK